MRCLKKCIKVIEYTITGYSLFVIIWFLSNRFLQDAWWGLVVLDKFAEYFVLPAVLLFLISLVTRRISAIAIALVPVLVFLFFYGSFFSTFSRPDDIDHENLFRVATYNIWNHNKNIGSIVSAVTALEADVIALQEITEEQRDELTNGLKEDYPHYHVSKPIYGGTTALFSRHPLLDVKELDIQIDRPSIVADIVWGNQELTIVSAHLNPSFWAYWQQPWKDIPANYHQYIKDQNAQVKAIFSELDDRSDTQATFIACDCNSQETASTNRLFLRRFKDPFRTLGWQLGSTNSSQLRFERNLTRIDYSWYKGNAVPVAVYRGKQTAGSDHAPVIADFMIPTE